MLSLVALPIDILQRIISMLPLNELYSFALVCKFFGIIAKLRLRSIAIINRITQGLMTINDPIALDKRIHHLMLENVNKNYGNWQDFRSLYSLAANATSKTVLQTIKVNKLKCASLGNPKWSTALESLGKAQNLIEFGLIGLEVDLDLASNLKLQYTGHLQRIYIQSDWQFGLERFTTLLSQNPRLSFIGWHQGSKGRVNRQDDNDPMRGHLTSDLLAMVSHKYVTALDIQTSYNGNNHNVTAVLRVTARDSGVASEVTYTIAFEATVYNFQINIVMGPSKRYTFAKALETLRLFESMMSASIRQSRLDASVLKRWLANTGMILLSTHNGMDWNDQNITEYRPRAPVGTSWRRSKLVNQKDPYSLLSIHEYSTFYLY